MGAGGQSIISVCHVNEILARFSFSGLAHIAETSILSAHLLQFQASKSQFNHFCRSTFSFAFTFIQYNRQNGQGQPKDSTQKDDAGSQEESISHLRRRRPRIHNPPPQASMFETLNITHVLPEKEGKNWPNKLAKKENGNQFYEVHPNGLRRLCSHSLPIQTFKSSILDGRLIYTLYKDSWRQLQEASAPRHQGDSQIRDYGYGTSLTFQQLPSALYRAFSRLFFFLTDPICA